MIIVISPAKTIDLSLPCHTNHSTSPVFVEDANRLVKRLSKMSAKKIGLMMDISPKLAALNADRYKGWGFPETPEKQAIAAFKGEVYNGLRGWEFGEDELMYAQDHLRILSGMYGVLKPLDKIKPHRLEMGTKLPTTTLYKFWGKKISNVLKSSFSSEDEVLINLASNEYFKSVNTKILKHRIITPIFKDLHKDQYKVITVYAKKTRGLMTRFILENKISDPDELISFNVDGYYYNQSLSTDDVPVFTRDTF